MADVRARQAGKVQHGIAILFWQEGSLQKTPKHKNKKQQDRKDWGGYDFSKIAGTSLTWHSLDWPKTGIKMDLMTD